MAENIDVAFRKDSSLLEVLRCGIDDEQELRLVLSSLVLQDAPSELVADCKLHTIYLLAKMIMEYEDFCEGGPGIL